MISIFAELKRRNVHRMAVLYIVGAWFVLQITDVIVSLLNLPEWPGKLVILLVIIGFPVVMAFSWIYELTPEGLKKEKDVNREESVTGQTGKKLTVISIILVALGIGAFLIDRWVPELTRPEEVSSQSTADSLDTAPTVTYEIPAMSIAVLPFADMSPEGDQEYFTDGLSEELLNRIGQGQ